MKRSLNNCFKGLKHNHRFDAGFRISRSYNDGQCFCPFSKQMAFFHKLFNINEDIDNFIPCNYLKLKKKALMDHLKSKSDDPLMHFSLFLRNCME